MDIRDASMSARMSAVFKDHCNLDTYQYREVLARLEGIQISLRAGEIEDCKLKINAIFIIFDFLLATGCLTIAEDHDLSSIIYDFEDTIAEMEV